MPIEDKRTIQRGVRQLLQKLQQQLRLHAPPAKTEISKSRYSSRAAANRLRSRAKGQVAEYIKQISFAFICFFGCRPNEASKIFGSSAREEYLDAAAVQQWRTVGRIPASAYSKMKRAWALTLYPKDTKTKGTYTWILPLGVDEAFDVLAEAVALVRAAYERNDEIEKYFQCVEKTLRERLTKFTRAFFEDYEIPAPARGKNATWTLKVFRKNAATDRQETTEYREEVKYARRRLGHAAKSSAVYNYISKKSFHFMPVRWDDPAEERAFLSADA